MSVKQYDKIEKQTNINVNVFGDVTVRTRHHGLSNFIDYKIPSFPFEIVGYTFALFSDKLSRNSCTLYMNLLRT